MKSFDIDIGDLVWLYDYSANPVRVTQLHSGYYDKNYTGENSDGETVYFNYEETYGIL